MAINITKSICKILKKEYSLFSPALFFSISFISVVYILNEKGQFFFTLNIYCWCNAEDGGENRERRDSGKSGESVENTKKG